jgi:hypothetical protein
LNIEQEELEVIYIWAFPDRLMTPPSYHRSHFDADAQSGRLTSLVGDTPGALPIRQDLRLCRLVSRSAGSYAYEMTPGCGAYVFVLDGTAEIAGTRLGRRDSIGIVGASRIGIVVGTERADLLLVETAL